MQEAFLQIFHCNNCRVLAIWSFDVLSTSGREAAQFASQRSQVSPPQAVQHETEVQKQCQDHLALSSRKAASSEMLRVLQPEYCTSLVPALEASSTILRT